MIHSPLKVDAPTSQYNYYINYVTTLIVHFHPTTKYTELGLRSYAFAKPRNSLLLIS